MKRGIVLIVALFSIALTTACQPDPRLDADAYATRTDAEQRAADETQQREIKQDDHIYWSTRWQAASVKIDQMTAAALTVSKWTVSLVIIALGVSIARSLYVIGNGYGQVTLQRLELRSRLIPLDPVTRQYPLLLEKIGEGKFTLTNPNTDSVLMLDTHKAADRMMVLAMARTQGLGTLARESRLSLKPGEVAGLDLPRLEVEVIEQ
jgi:hypothetical protein